MDDDKVVLIVEDNEDIRLVFTTMLRYAGYRVLEAVDGEMGLRLAREYHPDLVLMDISLPRLTGFDAAAILKDLEETSDIPLIAVTAHDWARISEAQQRSVFDDYLPKPVPPTRLLERVQRWIGAAPDTAGALIPA